MRWGWMQVTTPIPPRRGGGSIFFLTSSLIGRALYLPPELWATHRHRSVSGKRKTTRRKGWAAMGAQNTSPAPAASQSSLTPSQGQPLQNPPSSRAYTNSDRNELRQTSGVVNLLVLARFIP